MSGSDPGPPEGEATLVTVYGHVETLRVSQTPGSWDDTGHPSAMFQGDLDLVSGQDRSSL